MDALSIYSQLSVATVMLIEVTCRFRHDVHCGTALLIKSCQRTAMVVSIDTLDAAEKLIAAGFSQPR